MIYIETSSFDPAYNLAAEQYVFENMDKSAEYFMFWQNEKSVIIGKNQNTFTEVNQNFVRENNVKVVRRLSGGGAVYHDLGNLNFTYIVDDRNMGNINLHLFCQPLVCALGNLGIKADISSRNDITIDGKKFSGNAQYKRDGRVMHHGTIMFDVNVENLVKALNVSDVKIISKGIKSVRNRVANIKDYLTEKIDINTFKNILLDKMFGENIRKYSFSAQDIAEITKIKQERYDTWDWNYGKLFSGQIISKKRKVDDCGVIDIVISIEAGAISFIKFYGDFFGIKDVDQVSALLTGHSMEYSEILSVLSSCNLEDYFHNLKPEELTKIILN